MLFCICFFKKMLGNKSRSLDLADSTEIHPGGHFIRKRTYQAKCGRSVKTTYHSVDIKFLRLLLQMKTNDKILKF